jgi:hypothetical protein
MKAPFSKRRFTETAILLAATITFAAAIRTGDTQRSQHIQCPFAPNGKPYFAPGC